jgi:hypothetical protein
MTRAAEINTQAVSPELMTGAAGAAVVTAAVVSSAQALAADKAKPSGTSGVTRFFHDQCVECIGSFLPNELQPTFTRVHEASFVPIRLSLKPFKTRVLRKSMYFFVDV